MTKKRLPTPNNFKSRFCKKCNARYRYECTCSNNKSMAWQMKNVFHSGKRYKGKLAYNVTQMNDDEYAEYYRKKKEKE